MNTELRKLSMEDRIRLVEDLWDSIASDQRALDLTDDQLVEIDRRLDAYEKDGIGGRSAEEVIAEIRKRI